MNQSQSALITEADSACVLLNIFSSDEVLVYNMQILFQVKKNKDTKTRTHTNIWKKNFSYNWVFENHTEQNWTLFHTVWCYQLLFRNHWIITNMHSPCNTTLHNHWWVKAHHNACKELFNTPQWAKKNTTDSFYITMGSYATAETANS